MIKDILFYVNLLRVGVGGSLRRGSPRLVGKPGRGPPVPSLRFLRVAQDRQDRPGRPLWAIFLPQRPPPGGAALDHASRSIAPIIERHFPGRPAPAVPRRPKGGTGSLSGAWRLGSKHRPQCLGSHPQAASRRARRTDSAGRDRWPASPPSPRSNRSRSRAAPRDPHPGYGPTPDSGPNRAACCTPS